MGARVAQGIDTMNELLTPTEMAKADGLAIAAGISGIELMERAGAAVAEAAAALAAGRTGPICVVAGLGNNGGDGFVAGRRLREQGRSVRMLLLGERSALKGDAAIAAERWGEPVEAASPDCLAGECLADASVIVDALFGAGLARDVEGAAAALIEAINRGGAPVLAVDLPSGIDGETGAVRGVAVRATRSVTFFRRKPGHVLLPGRLHCGQVSVHNIGIPDSVLGEIAPRAFLNGPGLWGPAFPVPSIEAHKYTRGHCVVLSGPLPRTGAARLSARAALRAGAGLVTLATPPNALLINATASLAVMVQRVDDPDAFGALLDDPRINAVVMGPGAGIGANTRQMALQALRHRRRAVVLDADALTSFEGQPEDLFQSIDSNGSPAILTPHLGEFARLFKNITQSYDRIDKIGFVRAAAAESSAVVVLKGPDTVVAAPDGRAAVADNAPPWLATAGSGDVLAGLAGGLLAQGMNAFEAACAAVWLHGEAGRQAGPGLIAEDLPEVLPSVYRALFPRLGYGL